MKFWWQQGKSVCLRYALIRCLAVSLKFFLVFLSCIGFIISVCFCCCIAMNCIEPWLDKFASRQRRKAVKWSLDATIVSDSPLHGFDEINVVCLPVLGSKTRWGNDYHGLLLEAVDGQANQYKRLGTFKFNRSNSSQYFAKQAFTLV